MPVTDEYVDAVFRSIDSNHDNKIQPDELINFAKVFIGSLVTEFTNAEAAMNATQNAGSGEAANEEEKKE